MIADIAVLLLQRTTYEDVAQLPGLSYDFIVAGGMASFFHATLFDAVKVEPLDSSLPIG
jgi:hypothetical protein